MSTLIYNVVHQSYAYISAKFSSKVTKADKDSAWKTISEALAVNGFCRSADTCERKWANLRQARRDRLAQHLRNQRQTGAGKSKVKLDAVDEAILAFRGESNPEFVGIDESALDTWQVDPSH